jgi:hypothetical protein
MFSDEKHLFPGEKFGKKKSFDSGKAVISCNLLLQQQNKGTRCMLLFIYPVNDKHNSRHCCVQVTLSAF